MAIEDIRHFDPEDSVYGDTVRALAMAYNSRDEDLVTQVLDKSLMPLMDDQDGFMKMIFAFIKSYNSLAYALSVILETDIPTVIRMDATAEYQAQGMIMDEQDKNL
jgi:hypothetical protein